MRLKRLAQLVWRTQFIPLPLLNRWTRFHELWHILVVVMLWRESVANGRVVRVAALVLSRLVWANTGANGETPSWKRCGSWGRLVKTGVFANIPRYRGASEPALCDVTSKPVKAARESCKLAKPETAFTGLFVTSDSAGSLVPLPRNVGEYSSFYQSSSWASANPSPPCSPPLPLCPAAGQRGGV